VSGHLEGVIGCGGEGLCVGFWQSKTWCVVFRHHGVGFECVLFGLFVCGVVSVSGEKNRGWCGGVCGCAEAVGCQQSGGVCVGGGTTYTGKGKVGGEGNDRGHAVNGSWGGSVVVMGGVRRGGGDTARRGVLGGGGVCGRGG